MAEHQQQSSSSSSNENVSKGVGNSVVSDLMRVYENLTQSSTPQAGVPDASKALSIAYSNSSNNSINTANTSGVLPQTIGTHLYQPQPQPQPPPGYPIPPHGYQQQQTTTTTVPNNPLHSTSQPPLQTFPAPYISNPEVAPAPGTTSYPQHQLAASVAYVPVPMGTVPLGGPPPTANTNEGNHHNTQQSGEDSQHSSHNSRVDSSASYSQAAIVRSSSTISNQQAAADASSESDKSTTGGRPRRKRKQQQEGGNGNIGGKKGSRNKKSKKEDGRWSKRFTWPEDLHRDFVSAIFDVGLKHSSPSTIMEHMPKHEQITTERIKSHLQKYRLHRVKSKKEFISSYEASLRNFQQNQNNNNSNSALVSGGGEVAAHLTSISLGMKTATPATGSKDTGDNSSNGLPVVHSSDQQQIQNPHTSDDGNDSLMLPQLTEAEKQSPIGAAMGYLMGLFFSLKQQLIIQRSLEAAGEKAKGNALFSSSSTTMVASNANIAPAAATATAAAIAAGVEFASDGTMQQSQQPTTPVTMRTNIEENSMMKREMQNQMALQNKMRALKQQELAKYKNINKGAIPDAMITEALPGSSASDHHLSDAVSGTDNNNSGVEGDHAVAVVQQQQHQIGNSNAVAAATQGAGEMVGTEMPPVTTAGHATAINDGSASNSNNLLGIDSADAFWHTDVVDDQLFEFLMLD
mmetsp:Transcript_33807/g.79678  ORF Transcript_33807/g.79678 Transcript_33807/m.79678 type:complete len:688 (-) Transcript_33807:153-2216(-)|eukprot:CAMPEP_0172393188 /NCGR_PEP_ID=MMETSP1061-20121228/9125_1 /TAXON_ID=37318 /ORGANISM="Pseudo-nitzschia pungens, Strain cf. pungens" /LENGTH=687 /DNA_ID=CAMNT_0013124201 /DNA_START=408 /DNA_END=2471 /DNA_ORIENTATION=+